MQASLRYDPEAIHPEAVRQPPLRISPATGRRSTEIHAFRSSAKPIVEGRERQLPLTHDQIMKSAGGLQLAI